MATGGPPISGEIRDMRSLQSRFMFELMKYVYKKYGIAGVFHEVQAHQNALDTKFALEEKGRKEKSRTNNKHNKPFCKHLGKAIIALSHHHRINFRLRFHSNFPLIKDNYNLLCLFLAKNVKDLFKENDDSYAKFNEFLIVCGFLIDVNVYLAFRGIRASSVVVWMFYDIIYTMLLQDNFERHGSWVGLKRAARPWSQCYKRSRVMGIELRNPEYVYYNESIDPATIPLDRYPIIVHKFYEDSGDSSDIEDDPVRARPDDLCKIACGKDGCFYFCVQKPKPEEFMRTIESKKPEKLAQKNTKCAQVAREIPAQPGVSAAEPEEIVFEQVPTLVRYREIINAPLGFVSRTKIREDSDRIQKQLEEEDLWHSVIYGALGVRLS